MDSVVRHNNNNNWLEFQNFLLQRMNPKSIKDRIRYAKQYWYVLDSSDAQELFQLNREKRMHVLKSIANLAKYTGRYDQFLEIRKRYNLKWSNEDPIQSFERFFNPDLNLDVMLQRIKEMIRLTPSIGQIIKFCVLTGLRPSEAVESVKLINNPDELRTYYNPERQVLEHFRFPSVFLRHTKKAYISFVTPEILELVKPQSDLTNLSYNTIRLACWTKGVRCDMRFCRKIQASFLHQCGISDVMIDLLQGRVGKSVQVNHYLTPGQDQKEKVLRALGKLKEQI